MKTRRLRPPPTCNAHLARATFPLFMFPPSNKAVAESRTDISKSKCILFLDVLSFRYHHFFFYNANRTIAFLPYILHVFMRHLAHRWLFCFFNIQSMNLFLTVGKAEKGHNHNLMFSL